MLQWASQSVQITTSSVLRPLILVRKQLRKKTHFNREENGRNLRKHYKVFSPVDLSVFPGSFDSLLTGQRLLDKAMSTSAELHAFASTCKRPPECHDAFTNTDPGKLEFGLVFIQC